MLESGSVALSMSSAQGKKVTLQVLHAGDLVGLAGAILGARNVQAQTNTVCRFHLLERSRFLDLVRDDAESAIAVASLLAAELSAAYAWIAGTALAGYGRHRLACFLQHASAAELQLTQAEIGQRLDMSREGVSRSMRTLRESRTRH